MPLSLSTSQLIGLKGRIYFLIAVPLFGIGVFLMILKGLVLNMFIFCAYVPILESFERLVWPRMKAQDLVVMLALWAVFSIVFIENVVWTKRVIQGFRPSSMRSLSLKIEISFRISQIC